MTVTIIPVNVATDTFLDLVAKANNAIDVLTYKAVTVDSNSAVGHAGIVGSLSSNTVYTSEIFGGIRGNTAPITVSSNTTFGANTGFNGANNYVSSVGSLHIPGANATNRTLFANNTTNKLYYGNLRHEITLVDGAGSLIDSDFLDGQDGTWYADIPARQGYVSVNKAGDTITGILTVQGQSTFANTRFNGTNTSFAAIGNIHVPGANATHRLPYSNTTSGKLYYGDLREEITLIDGAGSLIDSDFLDGQDGTWYADIPARQGYVSVNKAGDTITGALTVSGATTFNGQTTAANTRFNGTNTSFAAIGNIHVPGANTTNRLPYANTTSGKLYYGDLRQEITLVDGAGSLIDGDLLDGQEGAWYADIPSRQGYVSVNKAGDTITGDLTVGGATALSNLSVSGASVNLGVVGNISISGANTTNKLPFANTTSGKLYYADLKTEITLVDGTGSGIDSDLLDGQQGTYYADIPARLGYTPVNKAGDTVTGALTLNGAVTIANTLSITRPSTFSNTVNIQTTVLSANSTYTKIANTGGVDLNSSRFVSNTVYVANTTPTVLHQFAKADWNTVKYVVSILNTTDNKVMATELLVISDAISNVAHSTQYATITSNNIFGEFSVTNTATDTQVIFTSNATKTLTVNYAATHLK